MFAIALAGYMMSNSFGHGVSWFGVALPNLVGPNEEIGGWAAFLHEWLAYGLLALVALHVAGVIKHCVAEKQNLVKRMW